MSKHSEDVATIEELYIKEKSKVKMFMISTAVLGVLLVGSLLVIVNDTDGDEHTPISSTLTQGQGGGLGGGSRVAVTSLFNSDGSLNTAAVDDMVAALPPEVKDRFLGRFGDRVQYSVTSGEITQAQADVLYDYLKLETVES